MNDHRETLQIGDAVPHFDVRTLDGGDVSYSSLWQHRNLVLAALPATNPADEYADALRDRCSAFDEQVSTCVVTHERIAGLPVPGLLVADRWGEIVHVVTPQAVAGLPSADQLLQWLEAIEYRCPECEGEAR